MFVGSVNCSTKAAGLYSEGATTESDGEGEPEGDDDGDSEGAAKTGISQNIPKMTNRLNKTTV
jgi:hypothetical protein